MSTQVQDVYNTCCNVLLEPYLSGVAAGLTLTSNSSVFLDYFASVFQDFLGRTRLVKALFTQPVQAGVVDYAVPNDLIQPEECFLGGTRLEATALDDLDTYDPGWETEQDIPTHWRQDGLPIKTVSLSPIPNYNGTTYSGVPTATQPVGVYNQFNPTDNNLTMLGGQGVASNTWTLGQVIPVLPDSFTLYLAYGILERFFSEDGENKDVARAQYCGQRYLEGINLLRAIAEEILEE